MAGATARGTASTARGAELRAHADADGDGVQRQRLDLDEPVPLDQPIRLTVTDAATSLAGRRVDARAWSSPTDGAGGFQVVLDRSRLTSCGTYCWQWFPAVD
jgi:hypothetical protein